MAINFSGGYSTCDADDDQRLTCEDRPCNSSDGGGEEDLYHAVVVVGGGDEEGGEGHGGHGR